MKGLAADISQWLTERENTQNADLRLLARLKEWARSADNVFDLEDFVKGGSK